MRSVFVAAGLGLAAACVSGSVAQEADGGTLVALAGAWDAPCDGFGADARCSLVWEVGLHEDLMRVSYDVRGANGARIFAGAGVYRDVGDHFEGVWTDSEGSMHPLYGVFADGALTTRWGGPETEEGRTRYALDDGGGMRVTDWVLADDAWREFNSADYRRVE